MRPGVLIQRTARLKKQYAYLLRSSSLSDTQVSARLTSVFGQCVRQLPPSLRSELLRPDLQRWPHRRDLFANLHKKGRMVLDILLNDHLGTKNVHVSPRVLAQFCELHQLEAAAQEEMYDSVEDGPVSLLLECVGAVDTFVGNAQCREMVRQKILNGATGVSNLYLEALSNNEL